MHPHWATSQTDALNRSQPGHAYIVEDNISLRKLSVLQMVRFVIVEKKQNTLLHVVKGLK